MHRPEPPRLVEQFGVPLPRCHRLAIEVEERSPRPEIAVADPEDRSVRLERDRLGSICLQLDGVGAGIGGGMNRFLRPVDRPAVICRKFGDHEDAVRADHPAVDA